MAEINNFIKTIMQNDFLKFAVSQGLNSMHVEKVMSTSAKQNVISDNYISPSILEERQLNVTQMDVFSRLMMDRIIFLGTEVNDYTANVIQAQLLYLDSVDSERDINIYLNTPGGSVYAGLGIYDTMQFIGSKVGTICTGMAASMGAVLLSCGEKGNRFVLPHSRVMIHQVSSTTRGTVYPPEE
jgi:ATP-dependent Clp protease protease subunit